MCPGSIRMDHSGEETKSTKKAESPTRRLMRGKDVDTEIQLANTHQEPDGPKWPSGAANGHQEPRASWIAKEEEPEA